MSSSVGGFAASFLVTVSVWATFYVSKTFCDSGICHALETVFFWLTGLIYV